MSDVEGPSRDHQLRPAARARHHRPRQPAPKGRGEALAELRDNAPEPAAHRARALCVTLDLLPTVASAQLRALMEANVRGLLRKLRESVG